MVVKIIIFLNSFSYNRKRILTGKSEPSFIELGQGVAVNSAQKYFTVVEYDCQTPRVNVLHSLKINEKY